MSITPISSTTQYSDLIHQRRQLQMNIKSLRKNIYLIDDSIKKTKNNDLCVRLKSKKSQLVSIEKKLIAKRLSIDKESHNLLFGELND
jgi:hypothetical protein